MSKSIVFYRDAIDTFKCNIQVEGASISATKSRLVLEFDNGRNLLFYGKLDKDGLCEIQIPRLSSKDGNSGKATLEVIADTVFSTPWTGLFQIKDKTSVTIKEVKIQNKAKTISITSKPRVEDNLFTERVNNKTLFFLVKDPSLNNDICF